MWQFGDLFWHRWGRSAGNLSLYIQFALSSCEECFFHYCSKQLDVCHSHYLLSALFWKYQETFQSIRSNDYSDGNNWVSGRMQWNLTEKHTLDGHHHPIWWNWFSYIQSLGPIHCQAKGHPCTHFKNGKIKAGESKTGFLRVTCYGSPHVYKQQDSHTR